MKIAFGCDHGGFSLREETIGIIKQAGHEVLDLGAYDFEPQDDYPDYAAAVGRAIQSGEADRGIIICGSGVGAAIAANKIPGVRAGLCHDTYSARQSVEHDNANVLALGARVIGSELAADVIRSFLGAKFSEEERHKRRVGKIAELERQEMKGAGK